MASEIKVNKISPESGTTLTLGDNGDTINFGTGVLPNFENLTVTGDLTVDTNSLKVDSTNNFVGIGTASPSVALDVVGAITATGNITGTLATASQPNITSFGTITGFTSTGIDDNATSTAITINSFEQVVLHGSQIQANNNTSNITYSGGNNSNAGANLTLFGGSHASTPNVARFRSSATEVMRIDSSGNVGIGTSSPAPALGTDNVLEVAGNVSPGLVINDIGQAEKYQLYADSTKFKMSYGSTNFLTYNASNSNLGIGETTPLAKLHVDTSNSGVTPNANADELFVENSGNAGITIGSGTGNAGQLCFGDSGDNDKGAIAYLHDVDAMRFTTNGTEKMRIDSSGNVGINTTNTQAKLHIVRTDVGALNDGNSNGIMIEDTNAGISIGSATTGEGHIYFSDSNDADVGAMSYFHNNNSLRFRANANERMRIDSSGNVGIGNTIPSDFNSQAENLVIGGGSGDAGMTIYSGSGTGDTGNIFFADGTSGSDPVRGGITYNHGDNSMNFRTNDGANRIYISSAGKVGIGTSSPSHALQVSDKFAVDTSNSFGRIYLGRPVSPNLSSIMIQGTDVGEASNTLSMINYSGVGMSIELDSSASAMVFNVSGASTERMRISGNTVMIGKTSNGIANDGVELKTNDVARFTQTSRNVIEINRKTDDGDIVQFKKDGTTVGSIGSFSGNTVIGTNDTGLRFNDGTTNHGVT